jgi:protein-disulfide isomerase
MEPALAGAFETHTLRAMLRLSRSLFATIALVASCARPGASPRDTSRAASTASPSTTATAAGSVALRAAADTISQRADRGRILGDSTAKLWVIMASDFQCPYCKQWHDARFAQIMKNYVAKGRVRLGYVNFPLSQHQNALPAAEAGMCVAAQNKFLAMHESLFATQAKWETLRDPAPVFDSLAAAAGVNMPAYRECVSKHLARPLIEADHDRWAAAGVKSTPTFFVSGRMVDGGADADVGAAIDAVLGGSAAKKQN